MALEYASANLKGDRDVVIEAVKQDGRALKYASAELRGNIEKSDLDYENKMQKSKEVVLEAVKQNGRALVYASPELKADREIVLEAVKQHGEALKYASPALRDGELEDYINQQLKLNYTFLSTILFGAKASHQLGLVPDSNCVLDKLSGDLGVTRLIAKFAGVQVGERLKLIKGAAENL